MVRQLFALLAAALLAATAAPVRAADNLDIPFQSFRLDNGLTVIVHEDHKAPIVAVDLWYHVGSKNEKPGKTGFAHLFEHLMFQGSEHHQDEFFRPFELVGATEQNGTTSQDRTNFFENVPTTALDTALWLESDRMGHLLPAIDQKTLDEQRGVVQNEKRQDENQPYGRMWETLFAASFPEGHPYHWEPIGSMEDLNAASLADVKQWFEDYYGAANVVLVLSGDIDLATARDKAAKYFGEIPSGPPVERPGTWVGARTESIRSEMEDQVPQARLVRSWNIPGAGTRDDQLLKLFAQVLGGSAASRLDERLTYHDQSVDRVGAYVESLEIAGVFVLDALVKNGIDPKRIESGFDEELKRLLSEGPSAAELERAKTVRRASFARGIERVMGKADTLASCYTYQGEPGCFRNRLAEMEAASASDVRDAARRWLAHGDYTLTIRPFPKFSTDSALDRSKGVPMPSGFPDLKFPALERGKLKNGMPVVLARRPGAPVLDVLMQFDAGYATDLGRKLGTASFASAMLDEGSGKLDALAFKARAEELGAQLGAGASVDAWSADLSALKDKLDPSLALYADMIRHPSFAPADIERTKKQRLAQIAQEKAQPVGVAFRLLPPLLYGEGHPYAMPFSGSGTEQSVGSMTREDLLAFQREALRPDNATIVVAGDTTLAEIVPELDKYFGDWQPPAEPKASHSIPTAAAAEKVRVFLVDKPGAIQSTVIAGQLAPSSKYEKRFELQTANSILGGVFTSRLNMNLREDKHWAYGAGSTMPTAIGQRPLILYAQVQSDKTVESIVEMRKEVVAFLGDKPATEEEVAKVKADEIRTLPGSYETIGAVASQVANMQLYGRPDDYIQTIKARYERQTLAEVRAETHATFHPDAFTWVIVGDLRKIETPVRALNLGEVHVMDAEGKVVR